MTSTPMLRSRWMPAILFAILVTAPRPALPQAAVSGAPKLTPSESRAEFAKWDDAAKHRPPTGPGGTDWDAHYRSFLQTDKDAASKGFPIHAAAARAILADAARSPEKIRQHQGWVLFIKHFSQAYRPESATADLQRLYEDLVNLQFGCAPTPRTLPFDGDARLIIHRDVTYGRTHPEIQQLDAYLVKSTQPTPVVIEIHGGGWRRGSKSQFVYQGDRIGAIIESGISVISINYRLTPQHTFPAQMDDVVRAVQFVRSKAKEWNLDSDRIAALGGSAGAHLAAWVALHDDLAQPYGTDGVARISSRLACFVVLSGPMDLTRVRPTELSRQPLRGQDFANAFTAAFGCTAEQFEAEPDVRQRIRACLAAAPGESGRSAGFPDVGSRRGDGGEPASGRAGDGERSARGLALRAAGGRFGQGRGECDLPYRPAGRQGRRRRTTRRSWISCGDIWSRGDLQQSSGCEAPRRFQPGAKHRQKRRLTRQESAFSLAFPTAKTRRKAQVLNAFLVRSPQLSPVLRGQCSMGERRGGMRKTKIVTRFATEIG